MGKTKEKKSDDVEIMSIGKLYTGPWDKKYWSSSRGKDRYPYPVGYTSGRTQNGISYKMEIFEGPKGPSFVISSTDGKSCSGDTPEIAWENFKKKSCSQINLWRGKQFSCNIDGVERFGFKNAFVQRLLRELVANVSSTEQSLLTSNSSVKAPDTVNKMKTEESNLDSLPYSVKTHVTGKRSGSVRVPNAKRHNETHFKHNVLDEYTEKPSAVESLKTDQSNHGGSRGSDPSTFATVAGVSGYFIPRVLGSQNLSPLVEKCLSTAETRLKLDPMDISDNPKVRSPLSQEERELIGLTHGRDLDSDTFPKNIEARDRSRTTGVASSAPEEDRTDNSYHHMPILDDADICAPDTLDHARESICVSSQNNHAQLACNVKDAIFNDVSKLEIWATDSHPEDETCMSASNTYTEKCDADSVGQEITKSMMTVLLPRALPLLKTFTRKKKKSSKPLNISIHGYQEENNVSKTSIACGFISRDLGEKSDLDRQKEMAHISVVPDSFDYDDPQHMLPNTLTTDKLTDDLVTCVQLPSSINKQATELLCPIAARGHDSNLNFVQTPLSKKPHKDKIIAPESEFTSNSKRAKSGCHSIDKQPAVSTLKCSPRSESIIARSSTDVGIFEKFPARFVNKLSEVGDLDDSIVSSLSLQASTTMCGHGANVNGEIKEGSRLVQPHSNLLGLLELSACYVLPMPISMVQLIVKDKNVFICVTCGDTPEKKESTLFVYKAPGEGEYKGFPSLIGYMPIDFQCFKDAHRGDIAVEKSLLQLTPDAQSIVLVNNIRTPHCREGTLHCVCSACTLDCFKRNAVKIVQLNSGYASLLMRLETVQDVRCILVCEPSFLVAAEEGGKLRLWVMNSKWSAKKDDCYLPIFDCMCPCLVELQRVPTSAVLIIGHNGFGEFGLWDIDKRSLVSTFSSPGMSVSRCLPVSLFRWQRQGESKTKELIKEIMDATEMSFTGRRENHISSEGDKDMAVWLLISTVSDPDSQCYQSSKNHVNQVECWRLALLVNHTVIIGSALDSGAAALTSAGRGIIGTCDGLVYMWELSTGKKLANLHSFEGSSVSCITTDATNSNVVAIASGVQLLVYLPS